jgi:hypothetical protein
MPSEPRIRLHPHEWKAWWEELERRRQQPRRPPRRRLRKPARCRVCLAPLANGCVVCSDECDELAWRLCPTVDGELY